MENNFQQKILGLVFKNNYATEAKFDTKPYKLHKLEKPPSSSTTLTREDALKYYTQLILIRRIEMSANTLYKSKIVRGFCHLYSGQEAVAVGIKAALRPCDAIITSYRAHGWLNVMGVAPFRILAELAGKQSGCERGKGGSMHMYTDNFYGGNGIVGAQVPLGAGVAFALKYKGTDGVCIALYGDGASNQGQVFEAYNISKLWSIPCIFVCENNGYGMGTSTKRASANTNFYTRGDYIPGIWVDGMDILSVRECFKYAINYCSSGKGPLVVETSTYRYYGHSMSDPGTSYRSREEVQEVRKTRDPIASFKKKIISAKLVTADEIKKIDGEVKKQVDDDTKKSKADKDTGLDELATDVYVNNLGGNVRNIDPFTQLVHKRIGPAINMK